ncbi:hypothetical protein Cal7507_5254 [Calothrix sp. PCC 7507]|nr:hypothetical protein Cal7507_5254 [Calothrix sp. PCC 7507]
MNRILDKEEALKKLTSVPISGRRPIASTPTLRSTLFHTIVAK